MSLFVGSSAIEGTSLTLPTHQAGDLLMLIAFRRAASQPTIPAGWHVAPSMINAATSTGIVVGYKIAGSGSEVSGSWTNAAMLVAVTWRHATNYLTVGGNSGVAVGDAGTFTRYPALSSLSVGSATAPSAKFTRAESVLCGIVACKINSTTVTAAPTGMTQVAAHYGATENSIGVCETPSAVSTWSLFDVTGTAAGGRLGFTVELVDTGIAKASGGGARLVNIRGGADQ